MALPLGGLYISQAPFTFFFFVLKQKSSIPIKSGGQRVNTLMDIPCCN